MTPDAGRPRQRTGADSDTYKDRSNTASEAYTANETVIELVLVAMADRSCRRIIGDDLAGILTQLHNGRRFSAVAERLEQVAGKARGLADELGAVGIPDGDRPPLGDAIAAAARRLRPVDHRRAEAPVAPWERLKARALALVAVGAPVHQTQAEANLPTFATANDKELDQWERVILHLEVGWLDAGRPFTDHPAEVAA